MWRGGGDYEGWCRTLGNRARSRISEDFTDKYQHMAYLCIHKYITLFPY